MLSQETKRMIYGLPLLLLLGAVPARAGSIAVFSNLGPGQSFNTQQGWEIDGGITGDQVIANAFTPAADVDLTQAQLALGSTLGLDTMDLYLESDSSGAPGAVLAELTLQGSIGAFTPPDGGGALVTYTCTSCPTLAAGTQYWLVSLSRTAPPLWNGTGTRWAMWALFRTPTWATLPTTIPEASTQRGRWTRAISVERSSWREP